MIFKEIEKDLFEMPSYYYLAHCINNDYILGRGIAVEFEKRYGLSRQLKMYYNGNYIGKALLIGRVFNLVTKQHHYDKPTYETLRSALYDMKGKLPINLGLGLCVAMPRIGCGLDRLEWDQVRQMIIDVFNDIGDLTIVICTLPEKS